MNQFIAGHKIDYPVLFDSGQAAYSYILSGKFDLPQVFLIDSQGMIYKQFGYGPLRRTFRRQWVDCRIGSHVRGGEYTGCPAPKKK